MESISSPDPPGAPGCRLRPSASPASPHEARRLPEAPPTSASPQGAGCCGGGDPRELSTPTGRSRGLHSAEHPGTSVSEAGPPAGI
ncbi:unnamed protein product [Gadus morhua 'NCC']